MRRIHIRGTSGSGKSTLGRALAERLGIPRVELDEHWHLPGWQQRTVEEFRARVSEAVAGDAWVVDGNYSKVKDIVTDRADTLVWLDYPFALNFWRIVRRTLLRARRGEIVCNGNREDVFKSFFTRDSVIWWMITTHRKNHRLCTEFMTDPGLTHLERIHLRHPRETEAWLQTLPSSRSDV